MANSVWLKGPVINSREGGGGQVKFYPYKMIGGGVEKKFSHAGRGGGVHKRF